MSNGSLLLHANLRHLEVGLNHNYFVNNIMNHFYYDYIDTATVCGHMYQYDFNNKTIFNYPVYTFRINLETVINSEKNSDIS